MRSCFLFTFVLLAGFAGASPGQDTKSDQTNIDQRANDVLRAACQYLAQSPQFSLSAEIWREHVTESGQKIQLSRTVMMDVRRPNRLRIAIQSPYSDRCFWYNGKALTVLDRKRNFFSTTPMPAQIDAMLNAAHDDFGIDLPLIDVALSDPYAQATAKVERGTYFTVAPVLGAPCHHLAFTQENIDWQTWIDEGPQPVIRKFLITHKQEEGEPEFTALITRWNFIDRIPDSTFEFTPPSGATQIEMRKAGSDLPQTGNGSGAPSKPTGGKE